MATGASYFTELRSDRDRAVHATFSPQFEYLPVTIAPIEKSVRVFVNETEYEWLDLASLFQPTTNYWTYTPASVATEGIACVGVKFTFERVGGSTVVLTEAAVWGEDGELIDINPDWVDEVSDDTLFDGLSTDEHAFPGTVPRFLTIHFPDVMVVSKFGWTCKGDGAVANEHAKNMLIEVNVGTADDPEWYEVASNVTQAIGNAVSHTAGAEIDQDDYPTPSATINVDTQLLTLIVTPGDYGGTTPPEYTIEPALAQESDRIMILRETRQDRPWVRPVGGAYGHWSKGIKYYFEQIRFICQELCELQDVSSFFSLPPVGGPESQNDHTGGLQMQYHENGGETLSYADIELLGSIPGADVHQLVVERGNTTGGASTLWIPLTYDATPGTDEWSIDESAKTVTIGGGGTAVDTRIRRSTRTDRYWVDFDGVPPGWNTLGVVTAQKQARFMIEEACFIPSFYIGSPLSRSIFPRNWNWFNFVGTRNKWNVGGGGWGGGGEIEVYVNNLPKEAGTHYRIEWPQIIWVDGEEPGDDDDVTSVVVGGGGWGRIGLGGGGDDEETQEGPAFSYVQVPPVDWPGNNLPPTPNISVSVSSISSDAFEDGDWGPGVPVTLATPLTAEFGDSLLVIRFTVQVSGVVTDPSGGTLDAGGFEEWYIGRKCGQVPYKHGIKVQRAGDSPASSVSVFNCSVTPGGVTTGALNIWNDVGPVVTSLSPASFRLANLIVGQAEDGYLSGYVPFFQQWQSLRDQHAAARAAGVVSTDGFTNEQWESFLNPDVEFTDFDIPAP